MIDWTQYIERDKRVMLGKPVFRGTRITAEFIVERLAQGATALDVVDNYERLTLEHVRAALAFAAVAVSHDQVC